MAPELFASDRGSDSRAGDLNIIAHTMGHAARFAPPPLVRNRNPLKDEISIFCTGKNQSTTWISAPEEGFYDHTIRVHVPQDRAMVLQLYHGLEAGEPRLYTAELDGPAFFLPLWMIGRQIGYIVGWEEDGTSSVLRLRITNPQQPGKPFVVEIVKEPAAEVVTIASVNEAGNQLTIERYS